MHKSLVPSFSRLLSYFGLDSLSFSAPTATGFPFLVEKKASHALYIVAIFTTIAVIIVFIKLCEFPATKIQVICVAPKLFPIMFGISSANTFSAWGFFLHHT